MTWRPEFSAEHENALRRICNNRGFIEGMRLVAAHHLLLSDECAESDATFQQTRNAVQKIPALAEELSSALDSLTGNDQFADACQNENALKFVGQLKGDLLRLQVIVTRAAADICVSTHSAARTWLRVQLAKSIEIIIMEFGMVPTITRGGTWDQCTRIILAACGEKTPLDCTNYIRSARKTNNISQV